MKQIKFKTISYLIIFTTKLTHTNYKYWEFNVANYYRTHTFGVFGQYGSIGDGLKFSLFVPIDFNRFYSTLSIDKIEFFAMAYNVI